MPDQVPGAENDPAITGVSSHTNIGHRSDYAVGAEERSKPVYNRQQLLQQLLMTRAQVHFSINEALERLQAIFDGIDLAAEQVQDVRLSLQESPKEVSLGDALAPILLTLLSMVGNALVTKLISLAVKSALAPLRAALINQSIQNPLTYAKKQQPRITIKAKQGVDEKLVKEFDEQVGKFVNLGLKAVKSGKLPKEVQINGDSIGVSFRRLIRNYASETRLALNAMLTQFDEEVFLILHTVSINDFINKLEKVQKEAKKITVLAEAFKDANISGDFGDPKQLHLSQIRDESRLNAEAAIWALTLSSKIVVDKPYEPEYGTPDDEKNGLSSEDNLDAGTPDPPSGVPLPTEPEDPKVEFVGVDSRLQKYLRSRLVNPKTQMPFSTEDALLKHLRKLIEHFEKYDIKDLVAVKIVDYPLNSDPLDAGVN